MLPIRCTTVRDVTITKYVSPGLLVRENGIGMYALNWSFRGKGRRVSIDHHPAERVLSKPKGPSHSVEHFSYHILWRHLRVVVNAVVHQNGPRLSTLRGYEGPSRSDT